MSIPCPIFVSSKSRRKRSWRGRREGGGEELPLEIWRRIGPTDLPTNEFDAKDNESYAEISKCNHLATSTTMDDKLRTTNLRKQWETELDGNGLGEKEDREPRLESKPGARKRQEGKDMEMGEAGQQQERRMST